MIDSPLSTLIAYLSGEFENRAQAQSDPAWYVHLKLWQRPVAQLSNAHTCTLFLEQASIKANKPPYRQRILQLSDHSGVLIGQYFALAQPSKFLGAGDRPELLNAMTAADLVSLPDSEAPINYQPLAGGGYQFQAALPEGKLCSFEYDGQRRYVYLGFDVAPAPAGRYGPQETGSQELIELLTYDKGIAPDTSRGLWGALMGPFRMLKTAS